MQTRRESTLDGVLQGRGVLLSTYGMVLHNADSLAGAGSGSAQHGGSDTPLWDVVILDEVCRLDVTYQILQSAMRACIWQNQPLLLRSPDHIGLLLIDVRLFLLMLLT